MQCQNQRVNLEGDLLCVHLGLQMPFGAGLGHGPRHGFNPGADGFGQRVAHRAGPVVELDRAADEDAA